ncbi:MAG TPA: hypothetical protein VNB90_11835 [Cytophagaceae bacterium]|nr:hypothetical protein [Cytophagaceae bacterium]
MENTIQHTHRGPHPGILAIVFTCLFNTGLSFVISLSGKSPYYPGPWESAEVIAAYFQHQSYDVLRCAFFQFGAAIPLGLFTAAVVSRLQFFKIRATGVYIALFGGLMTAFNLALSALILWVMAYPGIAQDTGVLRALYYMGFAVGGVGYSVPLGLLIAGISVTGGLTKLIPKWLMWVGLFLAACGELSFLSLLFPKLLFLIPLTRFPGFLWLIAVGFVLPKKELAFPRP